MRTHEALAAAADIVEVDGWCRDRLFDRLDDAGPCCMLGAVVRATGRLRYASAAEAFLFSQLADPAGWNDKAGRTAGQVADKLRQLASFAYETGLA